MSEEERFWRALAAQYGHYFDAVMPAEFRRHD